MTRREVPDRTVERRPRRQYRPASGVRGVTPAAADRALSREDNAADPNRLIFYVLRAMALRDLFEIGDKRDPH